MKAKSIIGIVVAIGVIVVGGIYIDSSMNNKSTINNTKAVGTIAVAKENNQTFKSTKVPFSQNETDSYYKLSQVVGDIGLPSGSMTTNLNLYNTINGVNYYKTYTYDTRSAYNNDNTTPVNGNYSHLSNMKIVSLDGQSLSESQFGTLNTSKLSNSDIESQIYKIASMYVEGYTANNPKFVVNANDNYEGNLNAEPTLAINLSNTKSMNNETLYAVTVSINNNNVTMYVGLDGYVYVASQSDYNKLFFPNKN